MKFFSQLDVISQLDDVVSRRGAIVPERVTAAVYNKYTAEPIIIVVIMLFSDLSSNETV